jgi:hypothetical protein
MELKTFEVTYYQYLNSDMKTTGLWTGKDEDDCRRSWEATHSLYALISLKEKVDA